uniref:Non-SMC condensin II complex, subunit G2 n=1 Tax=Hippocampus comes TaxID=109280 RepID=A0A3Q2XYN6_HIPCM
MTKREAFVEAACQENVDDFLRLIQLHKDRSDPFDIEEVMEEMSKNQREALWLKLASLLRDVLMEVPPERWEEAMDVETKHVMDIVAGVTLVATVSLKVLQDGDAYHGLLDITHQLHGLFGITLQISLSKAIFPLTILSYFSHPDVLVSFPMTEAHLMLHIHTLCEAWWKKDLLDKDTFGHTALVITLKKSFLLKKPYAEVQRAWSLHKVLSNVDYMSEEGQQLGEQLARCFQHPAIISLDDGKRLMVFLFSWHVDFIPRIHGTIKNQMEFFNKMTMAHVAEIYFRAWKKASDNFQEKIESECIQDFMKCAILLQRSSPVHRKVQQIIFHFHKKKICRPVGKMLSVLYKPILWKYLNVRTAHPFVPLFRSIDLSAARVQSLNLFSSPQVPNFEVRTNATVLFTDAFPIVDPDKEIEVDLQKQLDTLMVLLFDKHDVVRCNAIQGVCKILDRCWELLPPDVIVDFLKKLKDLAGDCSSDDVRCAVFTYLRIVLDNVLSHPVLEKLVPKFKYSLHDISVKVRVAFVDMLLKIKAVRAAKFWDVCSLDHLVARLASDTAHVSKRLTELLFDSFFPADAESNWCSRCITLIQMNPMAARKFYLYAHMHTAPTNIVKLMLAIRRVLNSSIQSDGDDAELNDSSKENRMPQGENQLALEKDVVASLLEVVVVLWKNVDRTLQQSDETQKYLYAQFGRVLSKYFSKFTDERCQAPLMQMASFMPANAVATFSYGVLSRLRKLEPGAPPSAYSQLLDCMCSWGKTAGVLELIIDWLSEALPENQVVNAKRKVTIQVTAEAKPELALAYLDYLLLHRSTRNKVLALREGPLKRLYTLLGNWKSQLYSHLSSSSGGPAGAELALKAFTSHGCLSVHLQHDLSDGREYLQSLEHTAAWVGESVLPFLANGPPGDAGDEAESLRAFAAEITKTFLTVCRDAVLCLDDSGLKDHVLHLCSLVILSEAGYLCIPAVLLVLKALMASSSPVDRKPAGDERDAATKCLVAVANIFQKVIELLARRLKKKPEESKELCQSALGGLTDFLHEAQVCNISGVFDTLFAIVIVETRYALQKMTHPEEVMTPETVQDLPALSGTLLSAILKSQPVTRAFLAEILSSLDSDTFSTLTELAAVVHLLAALRHGGSNFLF